MSIVLPEGFYKNRKRSTIASCSKGTIQDFKDCMGYECCKGCGACCTKFPCSLSPKELVLNDPDYMKNLLDTGILTIAPMKIPGSEDKVFYVIRPRSCSDTDTIVSELPRHGYNRCMLLGEKGCVLDTVYRPAIGLLLIPMVDTRKHTTCVQHYDKETLYNDWAPFQDILKELIEIYKDVVIPKPEANEETAKTYSLAIRGVCKKETK